MSSRITQIRAFEQSLQHLASLRYTPHSTCSLQTSLPSSRAPYPIPSARKHYHSSPRPNANGPPKTFSSPHFWALWLVASLGVYSCHELAGSLRSGGDVRSEDARTAMATGMQLERVRHARYTHSGQFILSQLSEGGGVAPAPEEWSGRFRVDVGGGGSNSSGGGAGGGEGGAGPVLKSVTVIYKDRLAEKHVLEEVGGRRAASFEFDRGDFFAWPNACDIGLVRVEWEDGEEQDIDPKGANLMHVTY